MAKEANPESVSETGDTGSTKKISGEDRENLEYECLWAYKQATRYENGVWHFEPAICEPKSRDNNLRTEVVLRACKICPIALKNLRLLNAKSGKITDLAKSLDKALPLRVYCCDARDCKFETFDLLEARRHQETAGYEHFFGES